MESDLSFVYDPRVYKRYKEFAQVDNLLMNNRYFLLFIVHILL